MVFCYRPPAVAGDVLFSVDCACNLVCLASSQKTIAATASKLSQQISSGIKVHAIKFVAK